jgi:hypothetical protein
MELSTIFIIPKATLANFMFDEAYFGLLESNLRGSVTATESLPNARVRGRTVWLISGYAHLFGELYNPVVLLLIDELLEYRKSAPENHIGATRVVYGDVQVATLFTINDKPNQSVHLVPWIRALSVPEGLDRMQKTYFC